jgi:hypothetical protein
MLLHRQLVEFVRVPLNNPQGILGTFTEAGPQSVTVLVGYQTGLPVNYFDSALGA